MSGYLTRLAESLQRGPSREPPPAAVRPRLPSVFEPLGPTDLPRADLPPSRRRPDPPPASASTSRAPASRDAIRSESVGEGKRASAPRPAAGRRGQIADPNGGRGTREASASRPVPANHSAPRRRGAAIDPAARDASASEPAARRIERVRADPRPEPSRTDGGDALDRSARPRARDELVPESPGIRVAKAANPVPRRQSVPGGVEPDAGKGSRPESPAEPGPRLPVVPAIRPQPPSARPSPPVVRITIGRVDVRAVAPAPPPAVESRPVRREPELTLSDYLRKRNGSGR